MVRIPAAEDMQHLIKNRARVM